MHIMGMMGVWAEKEKKGNPDPSFHVTFMCTYYES